MRVGGQNGDFRFFRSLHRVRKKRPPKHIKITSSNSIRFSKFFHCYNLLEIFNKAVIEYPTTPYTRRYTTL